MPTVGLLGALDTKGAEYAFLRDRIEGSGCGVIMINAGVMADPDYPVDYSREDVAAAAGVDITALLAAGDRGAAVTRQAEGATALVVRLFEEGRIDGLLGMGGSGGTTLVSQAMRGLPVGFPKLLVSTMASGDTSPYVDTSDITMMYSVVDIAGINAVSAQILTNAAAAITGMAVGYESGRPVSRGRPAVGATMYGTTTPCVSTAKRWLEDAGFEVLVFHANGPGGRAMEALMRDGHIAAALDITTTELTDELAGGTTTAGPDRLELAGSLGLPQVVSVGSVEQITFSPPSAIPAEYADRLSYEHNQSVTLIRSDAKEMARLGRVMSDKLNAAKGPVSVFLPLRGTSEYAVAGAVFHDPEADEALFESLRVNLDPEVELIEMDTHINDPVFAVAMAEKLAELFGDLEGTVNPKGSTP
ncbi:MAG: Tm-1-like ATP-binding domain-containing protein [Acidimicrobiia bacterium]|nr:Tm-1-like ATP-binding domain-containing protein [Acidimicrobiia bacterium]